MDLYPLKAQYLTDEEVIIRLETEPEKYSYALIRVDHLENQILERKIDIVSTVSDIYLGRFSEEVCGYGVTVELIGENLRTIIETAFDVVKNCRQFLRYGFVSDFDSQDKENGAIEQLRKYHINMVQFYDWSYRHEHLVSEESIYTDMMGKHIDSDVVRNKIHRALEYGIKSIAYGAVYAASKDFYEKHKKWAFYNANQEAFCFIGIFYIMNMQKGSPWRDHLIEQYGNAIRQMGFSGIHMDTYGFPKIAYSHLGKEPEQIRLDDEFSGLINETRDRLMEQDPLLIFNNVGNWPVSKTANSEVDAVYIEVWKPYERYFHIKQLISEAKYHCDGRKSIILAAYLEPFRIDKVERASYAAYLLTAAIVSNGACHLLIGENNAVLTQGYYGDYSCMSSEMVSVMRKYYDFMIRYMNLFYHLSFVDVSMTHIGWDNYEYKCLFDNWSVYGEPDKIWITIRENNEYKCLHLINLCGCEDDHWNTGKAKPKEQKDLAFCVNVESEIQGVYCATPDKESACSEPLKYEYLFSDKGRFVKFSLPELAIWSIVYIKL